MSNTMTHDPWKPYPGHGCDPVDTEADLIRRGSSRWLRENEANVRAWLDAVPDSDPHSREWWIRHYWPDWSDAQVSNMRTYLELVGGE